MKRIVILTGGCGAGKTTFARKLVSYPRAQADVVRADLQRRHPTLDWWDKTGTFKDTSNPVLGGRTPRELLIERAEEMAGPQRDGLAEALFDVLRSSEHEIEVVDDLRRIGELDFYRRQTSILVTHIHIDGGVPDGDCEQLRGRADYILSRAV